MLLALPDPCLVAVLRYTYGADEYEKDAPSMFSAARAHSRLHQAAVLAVSSIKAHLMKQQQVDSILLYLTKHGKHILSLEVVGPWDYYRLDSAATLQQLPHQSLQGLSSLCFSHLRLQLQPGGGFQGVLTAGAPLKELDLSDCSLLDGVEALAAVLPLLPCLQDLRCSKSFGCSGLGPVGDITKPPKCFPHNSTLQKLQQLTCLSLTGYALEEPGGPQHLQRLTNLQELYLDGKALPIVKAGMLSGLQQLVAFGLHGDNSMSSGDAVLEPDALAGMTNLQSLGVLYCKTAGGSAAVTQLMSHLQHMQQLTWLDLRGGLHDDATIAPAAAYSAVTANSKLRLLYLSDCTLPEGVWPHTFPTGRQLPDLQHLDIGQVNYPGAWPSHATIPDLSRLVSCCPGLQRLNMRGLRATAEQLAPLTGLSGLVKLHVALNGNPAAEIAMVCQLTGLEELDLSDPSDDDRLLLQLTQLKKLGYLDYRPPDRSYDHKRHQIQFYWEVS